MYRAMYVFIRFCHPRPFAWAWDLRHCSVVFTVEFCKARNNFFDSLMCYWYCDYFSGNPGNSVSKSVIRLCLCMYCTCHIVSWRFTILLLGEIGRQVVQAPLVTSISPYLIPPTHPTKLARLFGLYSFLF